MGGESELSCEVQGVKHNEVQARSSQDWVDVERVHLDVVIVMTTQSLNHDRKLCSTPH
jgi:hypothetical protein